jgi:hypothetical protein
MDKLALANFISETAFVFVYEIAGAVIAISVLLILILRFKRIFKFGS